MTPEQYICNRILSQHESVDRRLPTDKSMRNLATSLQVRRIFDLLPPSAINEMDAVAAACIALYIAFSKKSTVMTDIQFVYYNNRDTTVTMISKFVEHYKIYKTKASREQLARVYRKFYASGRAFVRNETLCVTTWSWGKVVTIDSFLKDYYP